MTRNLTLLLIALLIVSGYLFDVYLVLSGKIQTTDPNQLLMIGQAVGGLQGMAMVVVGYFFGTTKGSEEKTAAVSDAISKLPSVPSSTTISTTTTNTTPAKKVKP